MSARDTNVISAKPMAMVAMLALAVVSSCASPDPLREHDVSMFPAGVFHEEIEEWYGKHLKAMNEPPLRSVADESDEAYRFLWLRTFHHPVAVLVSRRGNRYQQRATILSGAGGYEPGSILETRSKLLDVEQWTRMSASVAKAQFWEIPTDGDSIGWDGAEWIVEGWRAGEYKAVSRWSPKANGDQRDFRRLGLLFLDLANISVPNQELY